MTLSSAARGQSSAKEGLFSGIPLPVSRLRPAVVRALSGYDLVIVPGLDDSGPQHWQSRWESLFAANGLSVDRVRQQDWAYPDRAIWHAGLTDTVQGRERPVLLIAHSLGAVLSAGFQHPAVAGALLVAPADTEQCRLAERTRIADFASLPVTTLNFPALLVASRNDEWLSLSRARWLATRWGVEMFDAGEAGHIGNRSQLGDWPDGLKALRRLLDIMGALPAASSDFHDPDMRISSQ